MDRAIRIEWTVRIAARTARGERVRCGKVGLNARNRAVGVTGVEVYRPHEVPLGIGQPFSKASRATGQCGCYYDLDGVIYRNVPVADPVIAGTQNEIDIVAWLSLPTATGVRLRPEFPRSDSTAIPLGSVTHEGIEGARADRRIVGHAIR